MLKTAYQIGVEMALVDAGLIEKDAGIVDFLAKLFGRAPAKPGTFEAWKKTQAAKNVLKGGDATQTQAYRKAMKGAPAGGRRPSPKMKGAPAGGRRPSPKKI